MVKTELLDHDFTDSELGGLTKKELACSNCRGRSCGYKAMRIIMGKSIRVCLKDERNRKILNMEATLASPYIESQYFRSSY